MCGRDRVQGSWRGQAMITEVFIAVDRDEVYRATLPPGEYVIGRDPDAQIRIDHPTVSRLHAKLIVEEDHLVLADLDSGNGTTIDDSQLVAPSHFYEGQTARLGDVLLRARQNVTPEVLPPSVGNYRRGDIVAAGGMGAIHEARQSAMGRKVAMKVMLREESESGLRRFINEARITGMLEHPNIVPVHELGLDENGRAFYTMKFVHGTTLADVLAGLRTRHRDAVKNYPLSFLLTVFQKVCDAIAFAHSRGVHHRDLKPENVMIGDFGEVLVMDWGLSKEAGFASDAEDVLPASQSSDGTGWRTMDGSVLGTPAYMAPEQARGEINAIDARSDIYALGAVLHEMLYLHPPVSGSNSHEIVEKVGRGELDPVQEMKRPHLPGGKVPTSLEAVRRKAMAFEPDRRYQHVTDLQGDITAYQSGFATSAEGAGLGKHVMLFIKRNRGVSVAVAAGFLLLFGSSVWFTTVLIQSSEWMDNQVRLRELEIEEKHDQARKREEVQREFESHKLKTDEVVTDLKQMAEKASELELSKEELQRLHERDRLSLAQVAAEAADLARGAIAEGRAGDAVRLSASAATYAPTSSEHLAQHGRVLLATGRFREAVEQFELARQADTDAPVGPELALAMRLRSVGTQGGKPTPQLADELERFFLASGQAPLVRLVDAAERGRTDGPKSLKERLGDLVEQQGWRDDRIVTLTDGSYRVDLSGLDMTELPNLVDAGVVELDLRNTALSEVTALRGLSLRALNLRGTAVADLGPLRNMPELREVECSDAVTDLGPLRGAPLEVLDLSGSGVTDLGPLQDARLRVLRLDGCDIESFEPVAAQPIEELAAVVGTRANFDPIARMKKLRKLSLPAHAGSIDVSGLTSLIEVIHPKLRADGAISGEEFREMERRRMALWEQYAPVLEKVVAKKLDPSCLTVRETSGAFDLDLRGTEISDLQRLLGMPLRRLWLDTAKVPLEVEPFETHETLRHLSLAGANVPRLGRLAKSRNLMSLVVSRDTVDVAALSGNEQLERVGYALSSDELTAAGTVADFFASRGPQDVDGPAPPADPRHAYNFDDPVKGVADWRIDDEGNPAPAAIWTADSVAEGGRGGGHLTFYERTGNGRAAYFVLPGNLLKGRRNLQGGLLEFQLRVGREVKEKERVSVVLKGGNYTLVHTSMMRPREQWQTFHVPLSAAGQWTQNRAGGLPATDAQVLDALTKLDEIRIQAEYAADALDERTDLDDVRIWDAQWASARRAQFEGSPR
jgi:serine/threonine protein kinase